MIVHRAEIDRLHEIIRRGNPAWLDFHLIQNFHLALLAGFDEVDVDLQRLDHLCAKFSAEEIERNLKQDVLKPRIGDDFSCGSFVLLAGDMLRYRESTTAAWVTAFGGFSCDMVWVRGRPQFRDYKVLGGVGTGDDFRPVTTPLSAILEGIKTAQSQPRSASVSLGGRDLPRLFGRRADGTGSLAALLGRVRREGLDFASLHWRTFEELVASLLEEQGLRVTVTPERGDGGRDIIAAGELLPGVPVLLAVEVKHKRVVGLHDVRAALYANRAFPAIMIATSGRFSSGVLRERNLGENAYRLFLKDGVALRQWLAQGSASPWAPWVSNRGLRVLEPSVDSVGSD